MHRPERWGYVQFSTAKPGTKRFVKDPTLPARDVLMGIYHQHKSFHKKNKRWAKSFTELGVSPKQNDSGKPPQMKVTAKGFEATIEVRLPNGKTRVLNIQQDSRLWFTKFD